MRQHTLLFLIDTEGNKILLARKKKGFGIGKLNGLGGKVEAGESIEAAAVREANEEGGISVEEEDLVRVGDISFSFKEHPDWDLTCAIFFSYRFSGEPRESDEMKPEWMFLSAIPYEELWPADRHWLPMMLNGYCVTGEIVNHEHEPCAEFNLRGVLRS